MTILATITPAQFWMYAGLFVLVVFVIILVLGAAGIIDGKSKGGRRSGGSGGGFDFDYDDDD